MPAGYSGTPLAKKLGIGPDSKVLCIRTPDSVKKKIAGQEPSATFVSSARSAGSIDVCLIMCTTAKDVKADSAKARKAIKENGSIWMSWPKKASGIATELTENWIRDELLKTDLVDVKVCAVDQTWSGLKFVIRLKNRK